MNRLTIVIFGHSYLAEENRKQLNELGKMVDVHVISPSDFGGMIFRYRNDPGELAEGAGWKIHFVKKKVPPGFPEAAYFFEFGVHKLLQEIDPDLIHIEGDPFLPFFIQGLIWSRFLPRKPALICTVRQNTFTKRSALIDFLKVSIGRILTRYVSKFICVNRGVSNLYNGLFKVPRSKMHIITQIGVDTELFKPIRQNPLSHRIRVGYCGRLVAYKGINELISAVQLVRKLEEKSIDLFLLGDGPMRIELEHRSETDGFTLLNPVSHKEVPCFLSEMDLFVMPSRIESWHEEHDAHAVLEAMSMRIPCLGTNSGVIPEVLTQADQIVEANNIDMLADRIRRFILEGPNNDTAKVLRQRVVSEFSLAAVAKKTVDVYESALGE